MGNQDARRLLGRSGSLLQELCQEAFLFGDAVSGTVLVGRAGEGGGLFDKVADVVSNNSNAPVEFAEIFGLSHA